LLASSESPGCSLLVLACWFEFSKPDRFSQYRGSGVTKELFPEIGKFIGKQCQLRLRYNSHQYSP